VIHPADYAILAGSVSKTFIGRAFALHTFTGNLGFALAPPVIALLMTVMGWRAALLLVGLLGVPVVAAILWQSRILRDQAKPKPAAGEAGATAPAPTGRELLLSKPMLLFFGFFLLTAMAGSGIQSFVIAVLGQIWGTPVAIGSMVLTGYTAGATLGTLVGGWVADRTRRSLIGFVILLTLVSMALLLALGLVPMPELLMPVVATAAGLALGSSRTPRDVMLKDASPPGQIGKVFGFVSSGLPLGSAIMPVPMGLLIDLGHPELVLPAVAALLGLSLLCLGGAEGTVRATRRRTAAARPVAAE